MNSTDQDQLFVLGVIDSLKLKRSAVSALAGIRKPRDMNYWVRGIHLDDPGVTKAGRFLVSWARDAMGMEPCPVNGKQLDVLRYMCTQQITRKELANLVGLSSGREARRLNRWLSCKSVDDEPGVSECGNAVYSWYANLVGKKTPPPPECVVTPLLISANQSEVLAFIKKRVLNRKDLLGLSGLSYPQDIRNVNYWLKLKFLKTPAVAECGRRISEWFRSEMGLANIEPIHLDSFPDLEDCMSLPGDL